jgi:Lrp/AsnC family transcriptional regulator, leucine-responsive regulatory protein
MANSKGIHQIALDDIDLRTLQALQDDSRLTTPELAGKVELSSSPCHRRVRLLEERGVIKRYVALLYQKAVALPASVFVSIKLESTREEALNRFNRAIAPWPEILECYLTQGPPVSARPQPLPSMQPSFRGVP